MSDSASMIFFSTAIILIGGPLLIVGCFKYPKQIFLATFLLRPLLEWSRLYSQAGLMYQEADSIRLAINVIGVLIPCILLLTAVLRKKLDIASNKWIIYYILLTLFSAMFHEKSEDVGVMLGRLITPFLLMIYPQSIFSSDKDLKRFLLTTGISTVFVAIAVCLDWENTNIHPVFGWVQDLVILSDGSEQERMAAVFGVPTATGFWLFQFFAVLYILFETSQTRFKYVWLAGCAGFIYPIYMTFSRSAWISCLILVFTYNFLKRRLKRFGAVVVFCVLAILVALPDIIMRMQNVQSMEGRITLWAGYFTALFKGGLFAVLLGLGLEDLPGKNVSTGYYFDIGSTGFVENTFIYILASTGLFALIAFCIIFYGIARQSVWLKNHSDSPFRKDYSIWTLSLLMSWFVMSMSGDMLTYTVINWYFYTFMGWTAALYFHSQKENVSKGVDAAYLGNLPLKNYGSVY